MKLYINYKIIKKYLKNKKRTKIFSLLKANVNKSRELDKKSCLLKYIFISKNFLSKLKKTTLISNNKKYNTILANEFNRNFLLKKIFLVLSEYHQNFINSKCLQKEKLNNKIKNAEFIQIKVLQKQTTKIVNGGEEGGSNRENNRICKKIIKSNIKII